MLLGEYYSPVGDKKRIALPKKLRERLSSELIVTRGYEGCLLVVDEARWSTLLDEVNKNPLLNLSVRETKRFLIGGAFELQLDKQGRFVIPESLNEYAGIMTQVAIIGVGEWIEIWNKKTWDEQLKRLTAESGQIANRLAAIENA